MTGGAKGVGGKDVFEVQHRVTVGAIFGIGLGQIGGQVDLDRVVDDAAGGAMVMGVEKAQVAGDAVAGAPLGRALTQTGS